MVVGLWSTAKFDHHGTENYGHALSGLVGVSHVGERSGETFQVLHVVVAVVGVFDESESCDQGSCCCALRNVSILQREWLSFYLCAYRMLHARDEDLFRIKSLPVLPVYPSNANSMLRAHCPAQSGEMIVWSRALVTIGALVFVQCKRSMKQNQAGVVLLVQQEE